MTQLILVRHGRTDWNDAKRLQGHADVPLNAAGRRQARWVARRLAGDVIHAVYSSDLCRARETAELAVAGRGLAVVTEPRLRELDFGRWEGRVYDEIQADFAGHVLAWERDPANVAPPGGETLAELTERVAAALSDILKAHAGQTVLVVAHGGSIQALLCLAYGLAPRRHWQFRVDSASVSVLHLYPEGPILSLLNDTSHLKESRRD
jgi:alpha-ribazole phosphatase